METGALMPTEARVAMPRPAPIEWAYAVVGLFLVFHYRWLMDDAFVYFRYVDNWLFVGVGPVYNAGEWVEGFSSPLHFLLLSAARSSGVSWPVLITGLGCAAFLVCWWQLVLLNRELMPRGAPVLNLPLAYLVCNYGFASFFTGGLETPLSQLLAPTLALYLLRPGSRVSIALLALAPLARPELALATGLAALFVWWRSRAFPWTLFVASALTTGAWEAFRIFAYADLLPNTFYLKDAARFDQGWRYLLDTASTYHLPGFALLALTLVVVASRRQGQGAVDAGALRLAERAAMLAIAVAVAFYVVRVGGTHVHFWYFGFPFTLLVCTTAGLAEAALAALAPGRRHFARWVAPLAMGIVAFGVFLQVPAQLSAHPFFGAAEHESRASIDDADWHRRHPSLAPELLAEMTPARLRRVGEEIAASGYERTRAGTWCRQQYAHARSRWVNGFGLTDALLARTEAGWLKPGHKTDLIPLGRDIARIEGEAETVGRGMYRRAVERGDAPAWVTANLATIELLERKIYNRHDFAENLALAFERVPRIRIPRGAAPKADPGDAPLDSATQASPASHPGV